MSGLSSTWNYGDHGAVLRGMVHLHPIPALPARTQPHLPPRQLPARCGPAPELAPGLCFSLKMNTCIPGGRREQQNAIPKGSQTRRRMRREPPVLFFEAAVIFFSKLICACPGGAELVAVAA